MPTWAFWATGEKSSKPKDYRSLVFLDNLHNIFRWVKVKILGPPPKWIRTEWKWKVEHHQQDNEKWGKKTLTLKQTQREKGSVIKTKTEKVKTFKNCPFFHHNFWFLGFNEVDLISLHPLKRWVIFNVIQ